MTYKYSPPSQKKGINIPKKSQKVQMTGRNKNLENEREKSRWTENNVRNVQEIVKCEKCSKKTINVRNEKVRKTDLARRVRKKQMVMR